MIAFLTEYGLFLAKTITVVVGFLIVIGASITLSKKSKPSEKLQVTNLNDKYESMETELKSHTLTKKELKAMNKARKAEKKAQKKSPEAPDKKRMFVINFHGDIKASNVSSLREEITAILTMVSNKDEVLIRLENTGGIVHEHGLAASQLQRLRDAEVYLTVSVDKVAASGGYMMACVANKIITAPFAVIGSIGVLAQMPNFHDMLARHGVKFEQETAGEYKRTVTMFGENTDQDRAKLKEQIEDMHVLFKEFVGSHRPDLDMDKIATGEHWYGTRALDLGLVDLIRTSDDYLLEASKSMKIYEVAYVAKKSVTARLLSGLQQAFARPIGNAFDSRYF